MSVVELHSISHSFGILQLRPFLSSAAMRSDMEDASPLLEDHLVKRLLEESRTGIVRCNSREMFRTFEDEDSHRHRNDLLKLRMLLFLPKLGQGA